MGSLEHQCGILGIEPLTSDLQSKGLIRFLNTKPPPRVVFGLSFLFSKPYLSFFVAWNFILSIGFLGSFLRLRNVAFLEVKTPFLCCMVDLFLGVSINCLLLF
jgi:hypothetical protein